MAPLLHGKLAVSCMRLVPLAARAAGALLALLLSAGSAPAELLVTVSDVSPTSALLWMQASEPGPVALRLTPAPPGEVPDRITPGEDGRAIARLRGLEPGRRYQYELRGPLATAAGEFATAPAPDIAVPVTLAWSGDLGGRGHCRSPRGWPAVDALAARRLDLFLLVGDTIYAGRRCGRHASPGADFVAKTLDGFRGKHRHNRADPALQRLLRRTPVVAIWDDHDVRNNFSGTTEPLMPVGLQAFLDYWPVAAPAEEPTRLYRQLRWDQLLELFILDTRQYRSSNCMADGAAKTMLGAAQRQWLIDGLAGSTATWKVVVSSVSLSIANRRWCGDSWARRSMLGHTTGFAMERDRILRELHARGVERLVVLVGDLHFAAAMTHQPRPGLDVHELVAGPLAASPQKPRGPTTGLSTRVHFAHGGTPTFGELRVDAEGLTARLFDGRGRMLAQQQWPTPGTASRLQR